MTDTATIIDRLNELSADTSVNWWDLIRDEFNLDDDAIDAADPTGSSTVVALMDGRWFRWDGQAGTWTEADGPDED